MRVGRKAPLLLLALQVTTVGAVLLTLAEPGPDACWSSIHGGWAACDQLQHLGLINYFIQHPASILDYPDPELVATLPGFHVFVALIARLSAVDALGPDTWLRLIPFVLGLGVVGILWRICRDLSGDAAYGALLCLPIAWSNYFYLPSLFLVTENAAYLGYVVLLMAYLRFPRRGLAIGLVGAAMVFSRQIFLPVVATHFLALPRSLLRRPPNPGDALAILLGVLPPVAVVAVYALAWHGLVPPEVRNLHTAHSAVELGPIIQAIGLLGVLAVPYGLLALPALRALERRRLRMMIALASIAALALWLLVPTTRDLDAGRAGSFLWLLARVSPEFHGHAFFALPVLALGCIAVGSMIELARARRYIPIELVMLALYVGALSMQLLSYQRYSEVVTLITLSATVARLDPPRRVGVVLFAVAYAGKLVLTLMMPQPG